jgi:hypothetical protein
LQPVLVALLADLRSEYGIDGGTIDAVAKIPRKVLDSLHYSDFYIRKEGDLFGDFDDGTTFTIDEENIFSINYLGVAKFGHAEHTDNSPELTEWIELERTPITFK